MGKIRVSRKSRVHVRAAKLHENDEDMATVPVERASLSAIAKQSPPSSGPEVVPLPAEVLKSLPVVHLSCESELSNQRTKKKDRRKLRHERWLQKLEGCQLARKALKEAELRKKTPIVGDLHPLMAALPSFSASLALQKSAPSRPTEGRHTQKSEHATPTTRKSQHTLLSEIDHFQAVVDHPAFKDDPLKAISEHIHNSVATGNM